MPEKKTIERARRAKRKGEAPSTQAGEFVREEIHHVREGKHGARSAKQAIAIGLSKARRAGVDLPAPKRAKASTKRQATRDRAKSRAGASARPAPRRSRATMSTLKREGKSAASSSALSRQAKGAASRRTAADRSAAAKKAARTRKRTTRARA
jgi:hypothetical protein